MDPARWEPRSGWRSSSLSSGAILALLMALACRWLLAQQTSPPMVCTGHHCYAPVPLQIPLLALVVGLGLILAPLFAVSGLIIGNRRVTRETAPPSVGYRLNVLWLFDGRLLGAVALVVWGVWLTFVLPALF